MIDLIPGHGWADIAGVTVLLLLAVTLFVVGLGAVNSRVDR
jgi:hypothetical protein